MQFLAVIGQIVEFLTAVRGVEDVFEIILAHAEEYDAYARNWQFQLLMFSLVRLPYLVLILCILMAVVLRLPLRNKPAAASVARN